MSMLTFRPSTSASVYPNRRSAAGLNASMRPRASIRTMPSTADSMIDRHRVSRDGSTGSGVMRPSFRRGRRLFELELLDPVADLIAVQAEQRGGAGLVPAA